MQRRIKTCQCGNKYVTNEDLCPICHQEKEFYARIEPLESYHKSISQTPRRYYEILLENQSWPITVRELAALLDCEFRSSSTDAHIRRMLNLKVLARHKDPVRSISHATTYEIIGNKHEPLRLAKNDLKRAFEVLKGENGNIKKYILRGMVTSRIEGVLQRAGLIESSGKLYYIKTEKYFEVEKELAKC